MNYPPKNPAVRRYLLRFFAAMGAYAAVLVIVISYLVRFHPSRPVVYFLAALPALPIIGIIVVVALYLAEEKDEFQRTVLERSLLWGMGGTLATTSVWGFLEMYSNVRHISSFYVFPLFCAFVGIAGLVVRLHYRSSDE